MSFNINVSGNIRDAKRLLLSLIVFEIILAALYLFDALYLKESSWTIHSLFNMDAESTIPAWFSSIQLFIVGLFLMFACDKKENENAISVTLVRTVGVGFVFLSADEAAELHEKISFVAAEIMSWLPMFTEKGHGTWIVLYIVAGVIAALLMYRSIMNAWKYFRNEMVFVVIGACFFVLGAIGIESIHFIYKLDIGNNYYTLYRITVLIEEFMEMAGVSIMLYGVVLYAVKEETQGDSVEEKNRRVV